jgi:hypothetical protein
MRTTDPGERDMSLTQHPTTADAPRRPQRRKAERLAIAAAAVVTILAVTAIAFLVTNDGEPAAAPAPVPSVAPSRTPDASPPAAVQTPQDVAAAEATARYREYLRVSDEIGQNGYTSSAPYDAVTVDPERTNVELAFRTIGRNEGARQIGDVVVASLEVTSVDLEVGPGSYPKVVLEACLDVSGVDVIDSTGKSLVTADRLDRSASTVTLYRYEPGTPGAEAGGWYVFETTAAGEPC